MIAEHKTKSVALLSKGTCVTIGCTSKKPALPTTHAGAGQNILHPRVLLTTKWLDFELLQRVQLKIGLYIMNTWTQIPGKRESGRAQR